MQLLSCGMYCIVVVTWRNLLLEKGTICVNRELSVIHALMELLCRCFSTDPTQSVLIDTWLHHLPFLGNWQKPVLYSIFHPNTIRGLPRTQNTANDVTFCLVIWFMIHCLYSSHEALMQMLLWLIQHKVYWLTHGTVFSLSLGIGWSQSLKISDAIFILETLK
jgi:hypothetical protein